MIVLFNTAASGATDASAVVEPCPHVRKMVKTSVVKSNIFHVDLQCAVRSNKMIMFEHKR